MIKINEEQKVENAQKRYEQAKAQFEKAKRKMNEKQRKRENHYKFMMGGIVKKYFPECMSYEEHELNEILSAALATNECKSVIARITREAGQAPQNPKASTAAEKSSRPAIQEASSGIGDQEQKRINSGNLFRRAKTESEVESA